MKERNLPKSLRTIVLAAPFTVRAQDEERAGCQHYVQQDMGDLGNAIGCAVEAVCAGWDSVTIHDAKGTLVYSNPD